jgi:protein-disulfide isomerase
VCAEEQGRFAEMDDALFGNQEGGQPVSNLAERIGLDMERFRACLDAMSTRSRIENDIAAGVRDGVRATPTYVSNGKAASGLFPREWIDQR